jgi:hypothetical protein
LILTPTYVVDEFFPTISSTLYLILYFIALTSIDQGY